MTTLVALISTNIVIVCMLLRMWHLEKTIDALVKKLEK